MLKQPEIIAVVGIAVGIVSAVAAVLGLSKGRARSILLAVIPLLIIVLLLVVFWHPSSSIIVKRENPAALVSEVRKASPPIVKDIPASTPTANPEEILHPRSAPSNARVDEKNWRDIQIQQAVRNEYFRTELNNCRRYGSNIFCEFDIGNLRSKELSGLLYCYDEKKNRCYIKGDDGRRYTATKVAGGKVEKDGVREFGVDIIEGPSIHFVLQPYASGSFTIIFGDVPKTLAAIETLSLIPEIDSQGFSGFDVDVPIVFSHILVK